MEIADSIATALPQSQARGYVSGGVDFVVVRAESVADVLRHLRDDARHRFDALIDVTAVDRVADESCFDVIYVLRSSALRTKIVVKAKVPAEDPRLPSVTPLWKAANWAEREVWDMFGVRFDGHPDLRRILMYEPFEGYPLRKTYPYDRRQPLVEERDPIAHPWPSRDRF